MTRPWRKGWGDGWKFVIPEFLKHNPEATDAEMAAYFHISKGVVQNYAGPWRTKQKREALAALRASVA